MDSLHVIVGRCSTRSEGSRRTEQRGHVLTVVKPDNTVLVHDADGYQPVAWLTRPDTVTVTDDRVTASDGDQQLEIVIHETHARAQYPVSDAGIPVGDCPDCDSSLLRARGSVSCPICEAEYPLPAGATVQEATCDACGLPRFQVDRGRSFDVCLDPGCEPLDERVRTAFDRQWNCPHCGGELRVLRRGGLLLGCDQYPDCETSYSFPSGTHDGTCSCGLPRFETKSGRRCLDSGCQSESPTGAEHGRARN